MARLQGRDEKERAEEQEGKPRERKKRGWRGKTEVAPFLV